MYAPARSGFLKFVKDKRASGNLLHRIGFPTDRSSLVDARGRPLFSFKEGNKGEWGPGVWWGCLLEGVEWVRGSIDAAGTLRYFFPDGVVWEGPHTALNIYDFVIGTKPTEVNLNTQPFPQSAKNEPPPRAPLRAERELSTGQKVAAGAATVAGVALAVVVVRSLLR